MKRYEGCKNYYVLDSQMYYQLMLMYYYHFEFCNALHWIFYQHKFLLQYLQVHYCRLDYDTFQ